MTSWTAARTARETGVSRTTIMNMLKEGKFPNAQKAALGWEIPITDIGAAGLTPGKPAPAEQTQHHGDSADVHEVTSLVEQLAAEHVRRVTAEAVAQERERTIQTLTETLSDYRRMLPVAPPPALETLVEEQPVRRRWWQKKLL